MKVHLALPGQLNGTFQNTLGCSTYADSKAGMVTTDPTRVTCKKCLAK